MGNERDSLWEPDELSQALAAYHLKFEEQHKRLAESHARWAATPVAAPSAAAKETDAKLKALQDYVRKLPRKP
jgi:uncharacterized protein YciW